MKHQIQFETNGLTVKIELSNGKFAIVDADVEYSEGLK